MVSLDKAMFGGGFSGDVVERHQKYANLAGSLDVVVLADSKYLDKIWSDNFRVFSSRTNRLSHLFLAPKRALQLCSQFKYDLLVTQEFAAPIGKAIKAKTGLPWIVTVHGMFFEPEWLNKNIISKLYSAIIRHAIKRADGFKVNNQKMFKTLASWGLKQPILVQPTPADIEIFKVATKLVNPVPKVLFVGRLSKEKNLPMLIAAAKQIKADFELHIVGGGSEEAMLKRLAGGANNIYFHGAQPRQTVAEFFRSADIFVLPSNTESYGVVLLQAQASGCAILATKTAGAVNLLTDGQTGILINVGDTAALRDKLAKLIADKALRLQLSHNARQAVARYNSDEGVKKVVAFWHSIAGV
jgi:glycosyltransferase involved in cell wall biosynthesis